MADLSGRASQEYYHDWHHAEVRYAEALAAFGGDDPPAIVQRESALTLAKERSSADAARDRFFKRTLK